MKDCEKRWKPDYENSVIASIMGINELKPKPPFNEKRRGLSESYIRNAASIGLRPGSLVSIRRFCSTDNEAVQASRSKRHTSSVRKGSSSLFGASYESRKSIRKNHEHCSKHVDSMRKSLDSELEMMDDKKRRFSTSISAFNSNPEKLVYDLKDDESDVHFSPAYREHRKSLEPDNMSPGPSCFACSRAMNRISQQETRRSKFEPLLRYRSYSHHPQSLLHRSSLADDSKKQDLRRWKMAKNVQGSGVSRRVQTLKQLALSDRILKKRTLDVDITNMCNTNSISSSLISSIGVGDDENLKSLPDSEFSAMKDIVSTGMDNYLESKSGRGSEQFQISLGADETNFGKDDELRATVGISSPTSGEPESEFNLGIKLEESGQSCAVKEVFSTEASLNEYFEEELACSNFSAIGPPGSLEILKRTNLDSPDSVLESFDTKSSSFECFDSTGLQLQLESLNFDFGETYSEGSVMLVSGDEDAEEEFGIPSHDSRKVKRWLGDGQSRNFSYMVDVLDEAGFCAMNSYMDFKMWYSLECPISPSVFEALEKKYGKQTSWQKSERQLLFDRITSGLLEIFNPTINFYVNTTSIRRKFCDSFRLDEVVDELWMKLVSQDSETTKDLSKKALDKWWELEEGIDIICRELEVSLFDELVMEVASLTD